MTETATAPAPTYDTLHLECTPLHTERPEIAAQAPKQAEAAYKRGAHVIGFTEVNPHSKVPGELERLAKQHGYRFIHGGGDTALAIQDSLKVLDSHAWVKVSGSRGYSDVTFDFFGTEVTVFNQHWATNVPAHHDVRVAQTNALIDGLRRTSKGKRLAFYMGDCNPDRPLKHPEAFPRADLDKAGMPLVYEDLDAWLAHVGVTALGHVRKDTRAKAKWVHEFDPLGSDHHPIGAKYDIKRRRRHAAA